MKKLFHLFLIAIISNSLIFFPLVNVYAAEALALPSGDLIAPEIKHAPVTSKFTLGQFPSIEASVTDNVGVKDVIVFYRNIGAKEFSRAKMQREPGSDAYWATLPELIEPGIEYYLQATDLAGNTVLHGHTFSPLTIAVSSEAAPVEGQDTVAETKFGDAPKKPSKGINKWVWIGLGVLAAGAIASSGGGGNGPTTGTVTISGPTPGAQ